MDLISLLREQVRKQDDERADDTVVEDTEVEDTVKGPGDVFGLNGRVAIVTGAGSGIGRGIATVFGAAGAAVMCADIDATSAEETAKSIQVGGGSAQAASVDVTRRQDVADLVGHTVSELGQLDIMCNNAGIIIDVPVLDLAEADFDRVFAVNMKGVLFGCQEAGIVMVRQRRGSIINISSGAIDSRTPRLVAYGVSKVGVVQLTKTLAAEIGPEGVRVNAIAPGMVETNITRRHYTDDSGTVDEARREATLTPMRNMSPLGLIGDPDDIGWAALYLASDAARFVTGQIIRPNGGVSMPW